MGKTSRSKILIFGTGNYHEHNKTEKDAVKVH